MLKKGKSDGYGYVLRRQSDCEEYEFENLARN